MKRPVLRVFLKLAVSVAILAWLSTQLEIEPALHRLGAMDALAVSSVFVLLLLQGVAGAWRWWAILRLQDQGLGFPLVLRLFFIGMFFNQTLSTTLGGDAARVLLLRAHGKRTGTAVSGIVLERAAGFLTLAVLLPFAVILAPVAVPFAAFVAIAAGIIALILFGGTLRRLRWRWASAAGSFLLEARRFFLAQSAVPILLLSVAIHLGGGLAVYGLAVASNTPINALACLFVVPLALLLATLPISLGGWGVREAALVGLFASYGIGGDQALAISVAMGFLVMAAGLPGGLLWLIDARKGNVQSIATD